MKKMFASLVIAVVLVVTAATAMADQTVNLPDFKTFANGYLTESGTEDFDYLIRYDYTGASSAVKMIAEEYVQLLEENSALKEIAYFPYPNSPGMVYAFSVKAGGVKTFELHSTNQNWKVMGETALTVTYDNTSVYVRVGDGLYFSDNGSRTSYTPGSGESSGGSVIELPDFKTFASGYLTESGTEELDYLMRYEYTGTASVVKTIAEEYCQLLLENSALKTVAYFPYASDSGMVYGFSVKAGDVRSFELHNTGGKWQVYGDTALTVNYNGTSVQVRVGKGLKFSDNGSRTSYRPSSSGGSSSGGSSGGGSSGGSSDWSNWGGGSGLPKIETNCYKCHGSGSITCTNCDGKGYKEKYGSVPNYSGSSRSNSYTSRETCFKCHGSGSITCTQCGGSGKQ